jgi:hypothetical protein
MPMPEAGATSPTTTANLQPSLLEERRKWVKHDREVKLDVFLSVAEEVMLEVFEVGPPLPPSNMNAQEMLSTLDGHFQVFKFEAYHHAFCHFLNLHIDQYPSIEDFNQEFLITLEDLLDYGHPLSNVQACSAYFSKLRCTQNPWVAKKLEEWDNQTSEVGCADLIKESPPWSIIRPLATKSSQSFKVESIPEEYLEGSSGSESDVQSDLSDASTVSSISLHSRHASNSHMDTVQLQQATAQRQESIVTMHSQEITIRASAEDIAEVAQVSRNDIEVLPSSVILERGSSKSQVPGTSLSDEVEAVLPEWITTKNIEAQKSPPPYDRPLPPLPTQVPHTRGDDARSPSTAADRSSCNNSPRSSSTRYTLKLEPVPQAQTPLDVHPALRESPASAPIETSEALPAMDTTPLSYPFPGEYPARRPSISSPNLAIPWPCTPDLSPRPHSSRAALPFHQAPSPPPSQTPALARTPVQRLQSQSQSQSPSQSQSQSQLQSQSQSSPISRAQEVNNQDHDHDHDVIIGPNASDISLPLQGTHDSAWDYLYESKGGYLITPDQCISPISMSSPVRTPPVYEDMIVVVPRRQHRKTASLDLVSRLSGVEDEGAKRHRKKKSWSVGVNVNLARFSSGKGVKEIV